MFLEQNELNRMYIKFGGAIGPFCSPCKKDAHSDSGALFAYGWDPPISAINLWMNTARNVLFLCSAPTGKKKTLHNSFLTEKAGCIVYGHPSISRDALCSCSPARPLGAGPEPGMPLY